MDGVLADIYAQYIKFEKEFSGIQKQVQELSGLPEPEAFPKCLEYVNTPGFFREAPPIKDSIEGLKWLNLQFKVLIVSSATQFPQSLKEKFDWLQEYYPFISWEQMIFCGKKNSILGDVMIDDHPKNLDPFNGQKLLFTQPHNTGISNSGYIRVENWIEIIKYLS